MFLNPWYNSPQNADVLVSYEHNLDTERENGLTFASFPKTKSKLHSEYTAHLLSDGRIIYDNHVTETSSWLPPVENWNEVSDGLPYGWEAALNDEGKIYYIDHVLKKTTYKSPACVIEESPEPRQVELSRDSEMGFGFVAGSEKPVIVRFVTDGGPSVDKLLPGDQIWTINGEDVRKAHRDHVIQLVRSSKETVILTVCQPPLNNPSRKSALLSAAKKQKLKSCPSRVRFAESVDIENNTCESSLDLSSAESTTPFMPNVLKVFLENGQTKSFKYDASTTVGDVLESLRQKLAIKSAHHFALEVEHVKSFRMNKFTLLDPQETLSNISARPGAQHLKCLYRITFAPREPLDLLSNDPVAFEYLFLQCCNDLVCERFSPELKYDVVLRLAVLHILQHVLSSSPSLTKVSMKSLERECDMDQFLPPSLVQSMKRKELRKLLSHFLKLLYDFTAPRHKPLTPLQAKLQFLKIISELPSFGAKSFPVNMTNEETATVLLICPSFGVSQIKNAESTQPETLCSIDQLVSISASRTDETNFQVEINVKHQNREKIVVSLEEGEAEELILVLRGYYRLLTDTDLPVMQGVTIDHIDTNEEPIPPPPYYSCHQVRVTDWNYATPVNTEEASSLIRVVDLSLMPSYQGIEGNYHQVRNKMIFQPLQHDVIHSNNSVNNSLVPSINKTLSVYDNMEDEAALETYREHYSTEMNTIRRKKKPYIPVPYTLKDENGSCNQFKNSSCEKESTIVDTESETESTNARSINSDCYGKLKHSDSLLLLLQTNNAVSKASAEENNQYGFDNELLGSPYNILDNKISSSQSSFGLLSSDNHLVDLETHRNSTKGTNRELKENSRLLSCYSPSTYYSDSDIIDLTMIPPPLTADENGLQSLLSEVNNPPMSFSDHESLNQELESRQQECEKWLEFPKCNSRKNTEQSTKCFTNFLNYGMNDTDETSSISSISTTNTDAVRRVSITLANLIKNSCRSASDDTISVESLRQLGIQLGENQDIDSFIADLTIPPPPEGVSTIRELETSQNADCNYSDYIIPPPPSGRSYDKQSHRSSDIIKRLYEAKAYISKVVSESKLRARESLTLEKDNVIDEMKFPSEQLHKDLIQTGHVASLQRWFETTQESKNLPENESCLPVVETMEASLHRYSKPKNSIGNDMGAPPALPARQRKPQIAVCTTDCSDRNDFAISSCSPVVSRQWETHSFRPVLNGTSLSFSSSPPPPPPKSKFLKSNVSSSSLASKSKLIIHDGFDTANNYSEYSQFSISSPKLPPKQKIGNKKFSNEKNNLIRDENFSQDSLDDVEDIEGMLTESRTAYKEAVSVLKILLNKLSIMVNEDIKQFQRRNSVDNNDILQDARESLISESRLFVTASKLFVKSATESEDVLLSCLSKCLSLLENMVSHLEMYVEVTPTPISTQKIIIKVKNVTHAFAYTVKSALCASGRGMDHPSMNNLMTQATNLAENLTALMKSLKEAL